MVSMAAILTIRRHPVTLADLERRGELDGYQPKAPVCEAASFDRELAETSKCTCCGFPRLVYRPLVKLDEERHVTSYRAFMECPACQAVEEI